MGGSQGAGDAERNPRIAEHGFRGAAGERIARRDEAARGILLSAGLATEGGGEQI